MLTFVFGAKREKFLKKLFYVSSDYNISTYEKQQIIPKQANSGLKVFQASANTKPPEVHFKGTIYFSSNEYLIQMIKKKNTDSTLPNAPKYRKDLILTTKKMAS